MLAEVAGDQPGELLLPSPLGVEGGRARRPVAGPAQSRSRGGRHRCLAQRQRSCSCPRRSGWKAAELAARSQAQPEAAAVAAGTDASPNVREAGNRAVTAALGR